MIYFGQDNGVSQRAATGCLLFSIASSNFKAVIVSCLDWPNHDVFFRFFQIYIYDIYDIMIPSGFLLVLDLRPWPKGFRGLERAGLSQKCWTCVIP